MMHKIKITLPEMSKYESNNCSQHSFAKFTARILPALIVFLIFVVPAVAVAEGLEYNLLAPLKDANKPSSLQKVSGLTQYAQYVFRLVVGMAGLIAVVVLIIGGLEYVSSGISGNEAARTSAHKRIWDAIMGLVLALSAFLILETINPELVTFKFKIERIKSTSTATTPSTPAGPASPTVVEYQGLDKFTESALWLDRMKDIQRYQCPDGDCISVVIKNDKVHVKQNPIFKLENPPDGRIVRISNSWNPFSGSEQFKWSQETGDWIFLP